MLNKFPFHGLNTGELILLTRYFIKTCMTNVSFYIEIKILSGKMLSVNSEQASVNWLFSGFITAYFNMKFYWNDFKKIQTVEDVFINSSN